MTNRAVSSSPYGHEFRRFGHLPATAICPAIRSGHRSGLQCWSLRLGLSVSPPFGLWSASISLPDFHLLCRLLTSDARWAGIATRSVPQSRDTHRISRGTSWLFSTHSRRIYVMRLVTGGLQIVLHPCPASHSPIWRRLIHAPPPHIRFLVQSARVFDSGFLSAPFTGIQLPSSTLRRYLTGTGLAP
jgi:hypothetical protein